ncbi:carboxypeptidase regulatory-like domain-containing protein, partial [Candidatus Parcubacteria bacterium]|nr:carboxypeptidase regulatory-like domain-containing protein [Candidatus Parcubacteria bacterium]
MALWCAGRRGAGISLIGIVIAVGIFVFFSAGIYGAYVLMIRLNAQNRATVVGLQLAQEKLELVRNLPFVDIGVVGGVPAGVLQQTEEVSRDGINFTMATTVRNVDDPFDGDFGDTVPGKPRDLAPADYKRVEIRIRCVVCPADPPILLTTNAVPKGLEGASANGALFITVFDANGQAVQQATVRVQNPDVSPPIDFTDTTDNAGKLQLIDIPPSVERYAITATKSGYSPDFTLPPGAPDNPNPAKPHATVAAQTITEISFAIDRVSTVNLATANQLCQAVGAVGVHLEGAKVIGQNPAVLKTVIDTTTAANGRRTLTDLEWDSYSVNVTSAGYDIAGTIPLLPLNLLPNSSQNVTLVLAPNTANS